jgi:hypothetical protein
MCNPLLLNNKKVIKVANRKNGHRGFWNPVKIFIRLVLGNWEKDDKLTGERYLVESEDVVRDLEDVVDEPRQESQNDDN